MKKLTEWNTYNVKYTIPEEEHHDHEADVDDSHEKQNPFPKDEGLNPAGPAYF